MTIAIDFVDGSDGRAALQIMREFPETMIHSSWKKELVFAGIARWIVKTKGERMKQKRYLVTYKSENDYSKSDKYRDVYAFNIDDALHVATTLKQDQDLWCTEISSIEESKT